MAMNFLKNLVHFDVNYNPEVVKFFLAALINESIFIRKVAVRVLTFILVQNKPKFKKIEIDPAKYANTEIRSDRVSPGIRQDNKWLLYNSKTLPKSSEEWDEPRYLHNQYTGYYVWPKKLEVYDSSSKQISAVKRMNDLTETEKEIYEFFSNADNVAQLIKYLSMEEKKGHDQFNLFRFFAYKVNKHFVMHIIRAHIFFFNA